MCVDGLAVCVVGVLGVVIFQVCDVSEYGMWYVRVCEFIC